MARYRRVDVRVWVDDKFRRLSPLAPSGQAIWLYLLTNPNTTNIPGLYRAGEAAMAEELGWSLEGFREAFLEAQREGLVEADWKARVVWIHGACRYNQPESANVVKSWKTTWDEIPDCQVKAKAYSVLKAFVEGIGKGFGEAFEKACGRPSVKAWANQDQDQDQDQDQETDSDARAHDPRSTGPEYGPEGSRTSGHALKILFGRVRSEVFKNVLPWTAPADTGGKASSFAAALEPAEIEDLEPTMRLACEHIRDQLDGWDDSRLGRNPAFAFGAWMSRFTELREELHGMRPPPGKPKAKAANGGGVAYPELK